LVNKIKPKEKAIYIDSVISNSKIPKISKILKNL